MSKSTKQKRESISKITVRTDFDMITGRKTLFSNGLIMYLLINIIMISTLATGFSYIDIQPNYFVLTLFGACFSALFCFPKNKIFAAAATVVSGAMLFYLRYNVVAGGAYVISEFLKLLNIGYSADPEYLYASLPRDTNITLFLLTYIFLMTVILYYSVYVHKNFILTFAVTFILPEIGLYNGNVPNYAAAFILLICWISVFAMQLNDYHANRSGKTLTFTKQRRKNIFYLTSRKMKNSAFSQLYIQMSLFAMAAILIAVTGASLCGYERSENVDLLRRNLSNDFSYKTLVSTIKEIRGINTTELNFSKSELGAAVTSGGLSMGNLKSSYDIHFTNKKLMELTLYGDPPSGPLYLRGFSAGNYSNSKWSVDNSWRDDPRFEQYINCYDILSQVYRNSSRWNIINNINSLENHYIRINDLTGSKLLFAPYFSSYDLTVNKNLNITQKRMEYFNINRDSYDLSFITNLSADTSYYLDIIFDQGSYYLTELYLARQDDPSVSATEVFENLPLLNVYGGRMTDEKHILDEIASRLNSMDVSTSIVTIGAQSEALGDRYKAVMNDRDASLEDMFETALEYYSDSISDDDIFSALYVDYVLQSYMDVDIDIEPNIINRINDNVLDSLDPLFYDDQSKGATADRIGITLNNSFNNTYVTYASSVIDAIKKYFEDNYIYSLTVDRTPRGEDFIENFLNNMYKGSCTYFASAAVELLRYYGIPARYVEGFMISHDDLENSYSPEDSKCYVDVLDRSAHAWVEVYYPSIGWLPVEFTVAPIEEDEYTVTTTTTTTPSTEQPLETSTDLTSYVTNTQTTTSAGTAASGSADSGNGGSSTSAASSKKVNEKLIFAILIPLLTAAMLVAAYFICINTARRNIYESIHTDSPNKNIVNIYDLILTYLSLIGIACHDNLSDMDRCSVICEKLSEITSDDITDELREACEKAVEAEMSRNEFSDEDTERLRELLEKIKSLCYERMTKYQRFAAKHIKALY